MASAAGQIRNQLSDQGASQEAPDQVLGVRNSYRLRRARIRLICQSATGTACIAIFYLLLAEMLGPAFAPYWRQAGLLALVLFIVPLWILEWWNWVQARRGIAELGQAGLMSKAEVAAMAIKRAAMRDELRDSQPYIDVMHDQIGDSLAESEREVMEVIEQIDLLNAKANKQREHIAQSIQSGKDLTESTKMRVEKNREVIAAIEIQLEEQNNEFKQKS